MVMSKKSSLGAAERTELVLRLLTRNQVTSLPLYPEERPATNPTSSVILKIYPDITRNAISHDCAGRAENSDLRFHRGLLQPPASPCTSRQPQPR
jgi:hypothetical protein